MWAAHDMFVRFEYRANDIQIQAVFVDPEHSRKRVATTSDIILLMTRMENKAVRAHHET